MTIEEFTEFWQRQGYRTTKGAGTFWYAVHPLVFLSLPYDRSIQPTRRDLLKLFLRTFAVMLRYSAPACGANEAGGVFVCEKKEYCLSSLQPKARNQTRRGLRECTVERVEFSTLATVGHQLNSQTWHRQGRRETSISQKHWQRYCQTAETSPDMEAWGAFVGGQLAAFVVCALVDRCYNILHQSSSSELLSHHPNNALAYTVTKGALEQTGVDLVCYGLKSVENTSGLEHFKLGMGFVVRPYDEKFVMHPLVRAGLALGGRRIVEWTAARTPDSDFWRKALAVCQMQNHKTKAAV